MATSGQLAYNAYRNLGYSEYMAARIALTLLVPLGKG